MSRGVILVLLLAASCALSFGPSPVGAVLGGGRDGLCNVTIGGLFTMRIPSGIQREAGFRAAIIERNAELAASNSPLRLNGITRTTSSATVTEEGGTSLLASYEFCNFLPDVVATVGTASSTVSQTVQYLLKSFSMPQISYSATSSILSAKSDYPTFLRTCASDAFQANAMADLMVSLKWTSFAALSSSDVYGTTGIQNLAAVGNTRGLTMSLYKQFPAGVKDATLVSTALAAIKASGNFVIVLFCQQSDVITFLTEAVKQQMATGYVWIVPDGGSQRKDGYGTIADWTGIIGFSPAQPAGPELTAFNARWASTYNQPNFMRRFDYPPYALAAGEAPSVLATNYSAFGIGDNYNVFTPYVYDAVIAISYAAEAVLAVNHVTPCNASSVVAYRNLLLAQLKNVTFDGLTGYLEFDSNGDRLAAYAITNVQSTTSGFVTFGSWNPFDGIELTENVKWSTGLSGIENAPPPFPIRQNQVFASRNGLLALALFGCVASIVMIGLVYYYRESNTIRAAAFPFCIAILTGSLLCYCAVFLMYNSQPDTALCVARLFFGHLGVVLIFIALFVKSHRIFLIFCNQRLRKSFIQNARLAPIVAVLTIIPSVYLIIWAIVDPSSPKITPVQTDITLQSITCESNHTGWQFGMLAIEGLLLLWGVYLSYQTRDVIDVFNESTAIASSIYVTSFVSICVVPIVTSEVLDAGTEYTLQALALILATFTVMGVIFFPKLFIVLGGRDAEYTITSSQARANKGGNNMSLPANYPAQSTIGGGSGSGQTHGGLAVEMTVRSSVRGMGSVVLVPFAGSFLTLRGRLLDSHRCTCTVCGKIMITDQKSGGDSGFGRSAAPTQTPQTRNADGSAASLAAHAHTHSDPIAIVPPGTNDTSPGVSAVAPDPADGPGLASGFTAPLASVVPGQTPTGRGTVHKRVSVLSDLVPRGPALPGAGSVPVTSAVPIPTPKHRTANSAAQYKSVNRGDDSAPGSASASGANSPVPKRAATSTGASSASTFAFGQPTRSAAITVSDADAPERDRNESAPPPPPPPSASEW